MNQLHGRVVLSNGAGGHVLRDSHLPCLVAHGNDIGMLLDSHGLACVKDVTGTFRHDITYLIPHRLGLSFPAAHPGNIS